jgi:hypothetical protein
MATGAGHPVRGAPPLSPAGRLYLAGVLAAAALAAARVSTTGTGWAIPLRTCGTLLVLAAIFLLCDSFPITLASRQSAWSPSSPATLAAVVLAGPAAAVAVSATSLLSARRPLQLTQRVFNAAMYALAACAAGAVYLRLGGRVGVPGRASFPAIIGPFAGAAVAQVLVNHALLWAMLVLAGRPRAAQPGPQASRHMALVFVSDLGYAMLGLLMAALWRVGPGPFPAVLVLVPMFAARWAMGQFAAQEQAYAATMSALCRAVETKDVYTRGHSERVSRGAVMIAREVGMGARRVTAIRYAGMLHDLGKIGVPTTLLQKRGPLTEEEYAVIQLHPWRGLEIVAEIGFLDEALAGIMHHHERIDGLGYPSGLAGDEIPEFARVLAVADAFDAMTSNRSYRGARTTEEAIADLKKWSGTQFDPALVDAFVTALAREGWPEAGPAAPAPTGDLAAQDHDDPAAPLRVVGTVRAARR